MIGLQKENTVYKPSLFKDIFIIMPCILKSLATSILVSATFFCGFAQQNQQVKFVKSPTGNKIDVIVGKKIFTSFLYPDTLEKPVLYPVYTASGTVVTRGFPLNTQPGDPTDHPHHIGIWFNFENLNGLDFWNNSYDNTERKKTFIRVDKNRSYHRNNGWLQRSFYLTTPTGPISKMMYCWKKQTRFEFSGTMHQRTIDRVTTLKANTDVVFTDAKDGMLGIRLAHALQMPTDKDEKFTDDKGNVTVVKGGTDKVPNGNYVSSEGKQGNDVWSTRGRWCKVYGRMGKMRC